MVNVLARYGERWSHLLLYVERLACVPQGHGCEI